MEKIVREFCKERPNKQTNLSFEHWQKFIQDSFKWKPQRCIKPQLIDL